MPSTDLALVAHLMRRAGFGATRAELEDYATQSYEAIVEDLLHPERFPEVADDVVVRYWMELNNPDSVEPWNTRWMYRMVNTARPLEEKMALFWHHVFATSVGKSEHGPSSRAQIDLFRRNAVSDMRTILVDLAKDPAMIHWLDNCENYGDRPNENWGRELLELFSMGVGKYTEQDIKMASRAFTGWTFIQPIPLDPYGRYPSDFVFSPNPPMRSGLGDGTRGRAVGRDGPRSTINGAGGGLWLSDGGPGQRATGAGSAGQHARGRQSRTGPGSVGLGLVDVSGAVGAVRQAMAGLAIEPPRVTGRPWQMQSDERVVRPGRRSAAGGSWWSPPPRPDRCARSSGPGYGPAPGRPARRRWRGSGPRPTPCLRSRIVSIVGVAAMVGLQRVSPLR